MALPSKTKELIINFRRKREELELAHLYIKGDMVVRVSNFKFLDLTWTVNTAQQRLYFLRLLRRMNMSQYLLLSFYRCSVESILSNDILVWFTEALWLTK